MPSSKPDAQKKNAAKMRRESDVIDSFVGHLNGRRANAVLVERPDRCSPTERTYPGVTTDGLVRVLVATGDEDWAVDVMVVAETPEMFEIPDVFSKHLEPFAQERRVVVLITGDIADHYQAMEVVKRVKAEMHAAFLPMRFGVAGVDVSVRDADTTECGRVDCVCVLSGRTPRLSEQLAETMSAPLTKKVDKQAAAPRSAGCKTGILLDAVGYEGIRQGVYWLSQKPETYRQAVESILAGTTNVVDYVGLLFHDDEWYDMYGSLPA